MKGKLFGDPLRGKGPFKPIADRIAKIEKHIDGTKVYDGLSIQKRLDGSRIYFRPDKYEFKVDSLRLVDVQEVEVHNGHWAVMQSGMVYEDEYGTGDFDDTTTVSLTVPASFPSETLIIAYSGKVPGDDGYNPATASASWCGQRFFDVVEICEAEGANTSGQGGRQNAIDAYKEAYAVGTGARDIDCIVLARVEWTDATTATLTQEYRGGALTFFSEQTKPFSVVASTRSTVTGAAIFYYSGGDAWGWNGNPVTGSWLLSARGSWHAMADGDDVMVVATLEDESANNFHRTDPSRVTLGVVAWSGKSSLDPRYQRIIAHVENTGGVVTVNNQFGGTCINFGCTIVDPYMLELNSSIPDAPTELRETLRGAFSHTTAQDGASAEISTAVSGDYFYMGRVDTGERKKGYWFSWLNLKTQLDGLYTGWWNSYGTITDVNQALYHDMLDYRASGVSWTGNNAANRTANPDHDLRYEAAYSVTAVQDTKDYSTTGYHEATVFGILYGGVSQGAIEWNNTNSTIEAAGVDFEAAGFWAAGEEGMSTDGFTGGIYTDAGELKAHVEDITQNILVGIGGLL